MGTSCLAAHNNVWQMSVAANDVTLDDSIPGKDCGKCLTFEVVYIKVVYVAGTTFYAVIITGVCLGCLYSVTGRVVSKLHTHLLLEHVECLELIACNWN